MKKIIIFSIVLLGVIYFLGWHLQPFESKFFSFHDDTQVGRMKEFAFSLQNLQIPPRLAPHFSFGMGFPVFNFYAPFSYWVGGLLTIIGIPVVIAAKLSFFLALISMFVGMYLFASLLFSFEAGLVAATVYTSSTWIATEIFARGNIGELWFIALLPLSLYMLERNSKSESVYTFIATITILSFTLTSHNVLSLVGGALLLLYCISLPSYKKNLVAVIIALLLSSYYFIPLITESSLTYAKTQAESTPYIDHFLCPLQLWSSPSWELGGSGPDCKDGMSFKLGKIQLVLGLLGFIGWFAHFFTKEKKNISKNVRFIVLSGFGLIALFMMFSYSAPIWKLFSFLLASFQFPWRFNSFFLFFISIFAGYFVSMIQIKKIYFLILPISLLLIVAMLISSKPYFRHPWRLSYDEYYVKYVSDEYIYKKIAYAIPEYLPRTANYGKWMNFRDSKYIQKYSPFIGDPSKILVLSNLPYEKQMRSLSSQQIIINTTYFPFWEITLDGQKIIPSSFDDLGRPKIIAPQSSIIKVKYSQTNLELFGNLITIIIGCFLGVLGVRKTLWKKLTNILK